MPIRNHLLLFLVAAMLLARCTTTRQCVTQDALDSIPLLVRQWQAMTPERVTEAWTTTKSTQRETSTNSQRETFLTLSLTNDSPAACTCCDTFVFNQTSADSNALISAIVSRRFTRVDSAVDFADAIWRSVARDGDVRRQANLQALTEAGAHFEIASESKEHHESARLPIRLSIDKTRESFVVRVHLTLLPDVPNP